VIIGLDGADIDLIRTAQKDDGMPELSAIERDGFLSMLRSDPTLVTPSAWTNFATGVNPGKHGIYYFVERDPGSYSRHVVTARDRRATPFWQILNQYGLRVGIMNLPICYPTEPIEGFMLAGFDSPGAEAPAFSWPRGLAKEVLRRVPSYQVSAGFFGLARSGRRTDAIDLFRKVETARLEALQVALEAEPVDVLVHYTNSLDALNHYLWGEDFFAPADEVIESYRVADEIVRDVRRLAASDADVIAMSDHGNGPWEKGPAYLPEVLERTGLMHRGEQRRSPRRLARSAARAAYGTVNRRLSRSAKEKLVSRFPGLRSKAQSLISVPDVDWTRSKAYTSGVRSALFLNVEGREPAGIIPPSRYRHERERIADVLRSLKDVASGEPVVEWLDYPEEVYEGPFVELAPDVIIHWRRDMPIKGLVSEQVPGGPVAERLGPNKRFLTGGHRDTASLAAAGPSFTGAAPAETPSLVDVAPTVLSLLSVPVPENMDGSPLGETLRARGAPTRERVGAAAPAESDAVGMTAEEEAEVAESLRNLGYLE
jgi:predicted AlkP superfamily phosphohydrolase/phosphomutase